MQAIANILRGARRAVLKAVAPIIDPALQNPIVIDKPSSPPHPDARDLKAEPAGHIRPEEVRITGVNKKTGQPREKVVSSVTLEKAYKRHDRKVNKPVRAKKEAEELLETAEKSGKNWKLWPIIGIAGAVVLFVAERLTRRTSRYEAKSYDDTVISQPQAIFMGAADSAPGNYWQSAVAASAAPDMDDSPAMRK